MNKDYIDNKECAFLDLSIHINNGELNTKIYDKRDELSFPIVNDWFVDGDVTILWYLHIIIDLNYLYL